MTRPLRILHVVGRMNRGGVETWLMHVLRNIDRTRFVFDFLVLDPSPSAYDEELRSFGSRLIPCPRPRSCSYAARFRSVLGSSGPFDVVHSHVHHFSGVVLAVAATTGTQVRIAHSHNALLPASSPTRRLYLATMQWLIRNFATHGLAASDAAAGDLFGANWITDPRWTVQFYGIDFGPFFETHDPRIVRQELGLPRDAFVVGHVGRFDPQKNHDLIIRIAAELCKSPNAHFVLVGDGPLRSDVVARVRTLGLERQVHFLGVRSDVARVLRAFDVFLFPSLHEGLGLVGVEAQAAGLPVLLSDTIPHEIAVVKELVSRQRIAAPPSAWATQLSHLANSPRMAPSDALARVEASRFNISHSIRELETVYRSAIAREP